MTIGENIRKIRKARGLTLKQLAEMSGYYYQHLHHIETSNHIPKVSTAIDIADVLEVSLDELVGRDFKKILKPVEKFPFDYCPKYKTEEQIKTEAVKEFAERYERYLLSQMTTAPLDKKEWINFCLDELDNLKKEMVGEG